MTEESSRAFGSFFSRGKDKDSSKTVKFMPNITDPTAEVQISEDSASGLNKKQHRRAQVRKAQIEHRQRKQNLVKHLEQDVIDLREKIAASKIEATSFKVENVQIKNILSGYNLPTTLAIPMASQPLGQQEFIRPPIALQSLDYQSDTTTSLSSPDFWQSSPSATSLVNVSFDKYVDATCLSLSPASSFDIGNETNQNNSGAFNLPSNSFIRTSGDTAGAFLNLEQSTSKALPGPPINNYETQVVENIIEISTIGINFILALEHPCRAHFGPHSSVFDPKGDPSGHELMASTSLYTNAPQSVFTATKANSPVEAWTVPISPVTELAKLRQMSDSLLKEDWEITPVQAWHLLVETIGVKTLVAGTDQHGRPGKVLEEVKRGLGSLVDCFGFGAVMNETLFWQVVLNINQVSGQGVGNIATARYEGTSYMT